MAANALTDSESRKVLVAQYDAGDREYLRVFLEIVAGYEVIEVASGVGLIKSLKRRPDLVVTDTNPRGNFMRALEIVRRTSALRHLPIVVYSADQGRLPECAAKGADGFIVKPSPPAILLAKIWKILGADGGGEGAVSSFAARFRKDIEKIDNLPTLPTVYAEVDRLCKDPEVGADDLSAVIQADPSITLKLLNLANSAFFGFTRQISSVRDAISLLGNQTVRNTILNIAVFEATKNPEASAGLDKNQFWLHSAGVGAVARFLSEKLGLEREECFTAGIIHDMGKIVLDSLYSEFYAEVLARVADSSTSLYAAEEEVIGLDHGALGRELAEAWSLPPELTDAVAHHHAPGRAQADPEIAALVHVGDVVSRKLGVGSGGDALVPEMDPAALERLGLTPEQLEEWEPDTQEAIERDKAVLSILQK
jgi:putative nucleotidyltransferase with HDIG domain